MTKLKKDIMSVIRRPRITEKSGIKAESQNVYTFEIADNANKADVKKSIIAIYGKTPIRINISRLPAKNVTVRGKKGRKPGVKKAVVYLKKEDKIEFI